MTSRVPLTVPQIFAKLESTSSKNEKIEILKENQKNKEFRIVVQKALDPFNVYYMKKIPDHKPAKGSIATFTNIMQNIEKLSTRKKTGNEAITYIKQILERVSADDGDIIQRVITKDLKCGIAASTVNKAWGDNFIPTFDVMLCSKYNEKAVEKLKWPVMVQEKMDGMRVIFRVTQEGVDVLSRSGKNLGLGELFRTEMFHLIYSNNLDDTKGYIVDGELLVKQKNGSFMERKKANGILNKAIKGTLTEDDKKDIHAVVWDISPLKSFEEGVYNIAYQERYDYLLKRSNATNRTFKEDRRVEVLTTKKCGNMEQVLEVYKEFISAGSEGVIIKDGSKGWANKRVNHQIKMKIEETADLIIKEVVGGEGKYAGMLGKFVVESKCGELSCGVGSGFSDAERSEFFTEDMVGKIVEVKYNEIISSKKADIKSLFLPIFVRMRNDKKNADTLAKLQK